MKSLIVLLCLASLGATAPKKPQPAKVVPAVAPDPVVPSKAKMEAAVKIAVETYVAKNKVGGKVSGVSATVEETRPMTGWANKYISTGKALIALGNDKPQTRNFTAWVEIDGANVKSVEVSI